MTRCLAGLVLTLVCCGCVLFQSGNGVVEGREGVKPAKLKQATGVPAYTVTGPYELTGTITLVTNTPPLWRADLAFTFPTGGYTVGEPEIIVEKSLPERVTMVLPVTPPAADAMVTQALTTVAVETTVSVSSEASFEVYVQTLAPEL